MDRPYNLKTRFWCTTIGLPEWNPHRPWTHWQIKRWRVWHLINYIWVWIVAHDPNARSCVTEVLWSWNIFKKVSRTEKRISMKSWRTPWMNINDTFTRLLCLMMAWLWYYQMWCEQTRLKNGLHGLGVSCFVDTSVGRRNRGQNYSTGWHGLDVLLLVDKNIMGFIT